MHPAQQTVRDEAGRYNVLCCGRRWGKNILQLDLMVDPILERMPVGWYEPTYKSLADAWREAKKILAPITRTISETERRIECITGGSLDMWTLDNPESSRGRKYKRVIINEAAMIRCLKEAWEQTVRPTLTDYRGDAWFGSTPKGRNFFWQLYERGQDTEQAARGWKSWQYPTVTNPHIAPEEVEEARLDLPERAFLQEYLAEFLEDVAGVFRGVYDVIDTDRTETEERKQWQSYSMGVDLARVNDFTVITVFDGHGRQVYFDRFNQISWELIIGRIENVFKLYDPEQLWIDSTGLGDPVVEGLQRKGIPAQGYKLTNLTKLSLIDSLAMGIERKMLRLMDIPVQTNELIGFEYEVTASGNTRMNAPSGEHDDTVISAALANHGLRQMGYVRIEEPAEEKPDPVRSPRWLDERKPAKVGQRADDLRM
jgi:hypothetical protein